jgi:hypothetical protein
MRDSNSDSSEDNNLAALERMREDAFSHSPDDWSEERRKLEREFRRGQIRKVLWNGVIAALVGFAMYGWLTTKSMPK